MALIPAEESEEAKKQDQWPMMKATKRKQK